MRKTYSGRKKKKEKGGKKRRWKRAALACERHCAREREGVGVGVGGWEVEEGGEQ